MNDNSVPSRDDLADRIMDLALREKAGGKLPPDLAAAILARVEQPVSLPESRRGESAAPARRRLTAYLVSACLLSLAALLAVLVHPDLANLDRGGVARSSRDGDLLRAYMEDAKRVIIGKIVADVQTGIFDARKKVGASAEHAKRDLKMLLENVERSIDLDKNVRSQLRDQVESALKETSRREIEQAEARAYNPEARAAALERQLTVEESGRVDTKILQLMERFNSISKEERFDEAETNLPIERSESEYFDDSRTWTELKRGRKKHRSIDAKKLEDIDFRRGEFSTVQLPQFGGSDVLKYKTQLDTRGIHHPGPVNETVLANVKVEVTAVSNKDLLEISVGADDGIVPDQEFDVFRSATYLARVKVLKTSPDKSVAQIIKDSQRGPIVKGDQVSSSFVISPSPPAPSAPSVANVKGRVTAMASNGKLVELSLGSDDGLQAGRILSTHLTDGTTLVGALQIVKTTRDRAVAEVIVMDAGQIEKGAMFAGRVFDLPDAPNAIPEPAPADEQDPSGDKFDVLPENEFESVKKSPLSTFSIDVDSASYSKVRQILLQAGQLPPAEAIRLEELVNYFPYEYAPPQDDKTPFAAHVETAACPWNAAHRLVRIGLKGRVIEQQSRPACNLVFLVDVSGSMDEPNKLPLVRQALKMLAGELTERDRVSIVVYAGAAGLVLPPTRGDARPTIYTALSQLQAGGSTNGGEGIELAYKTCQENFIEGGINRVILCTDGDFNVGLTSTGQLVDLAKEKAQAGVFLSVLGFGMGNHNDEMLEAVSNKANGNHAFIDSLAEARKVLVREISGTLVTIAKDVKIQVDFSPSEVESYRLLGYENRMLATEDFEDDKKDAGEIGGGHTVTALYEIIPARPNGDAKPARSASEAASEGPATPTRSVSEDQKNLLTLKLRYKQPDGDQSTLLEFPVSDSGRKFAEATPDFQFAAAVASFGMLLRKSKHAGDATLAGVAEIAAAAKGPDPHGYRVEFVELAKKAAEIAGKKAAE